jgi:dihydroorotate dehydrogenase (fumarate)
VVNAVNGVAYGKIPIWYKLGPMSDPVQLRSQAELMAYKGADGIVATNTFGGVMEYQGRSRRPVMRHKPMGLGGAALRPIGVGMVAQLREILPDRVDVIGVGGIGSGADVSQYLAAGAKAVQVGTACWKRGRDPEVFFEILNEFEEF